MWLGFDFGTQSVRVVAVSETGRVLAQSSQPLTSRRDSSRHQQDAEEWWRAAVSTCDAALATLPTLAIRGLAIDNTSGTILLIDKSGKALTAGLMYDYTVPPTKRDVPMRPVPTFGARWDIAYSGRGRCPSCFGWCASVAA